MIENPPAHVLPTWQGIALLAVGLTLLLLVPKLVAWSIASRDFVHQWLTRKMGLQESHLTKLPEQSWMERWTKFSYGFGYSLLAVLLIILGVAALLKQPF